MTAQVLSVNLAEFFDLSTGRGVLESKAAPVVVMGSIRTPYSRSISGQRD
jgi:hypothetical protein